jgi:hypothetical protein
MRGQAFKDHPHFHGSKGKQVILTHADHKTAIEEGIRIMGSVNAKIQRSYAHVKCTFVPSSHILVCSWSV